MITVRTSDRNAPARDVSSKNSDSGVVISMSGGVRAMRCRSAAGVSAVRIAVRTVPVCCPMSRATRSIPTRGARRFRSTSAASARSGEMYSTRQPNPGSATSPSSAQRNAASVLPDPVGETTRVSDPVAIESQACTCTAVGAAKAWLNQTRVASRMRG